MRQLFFITLFLLGVSLLLAELVLMDPGYVLVALGGYVLETSLIIVAVAALLMAALLIFLLYCLGKVFGIKSGFSTWASVRSVRAARQKTTLGLIELAEGHWGKARKLLDEAAVDNDHPLINYLNAARAADELGDLEARDEYLRLAHETKTGNPGFAVGLTQAQLQYQREDWERCLATLLRLKAKAPKHGYVMKMLVQVFQKTEDWEKLSELLPEVRKSREKPFSGDELDRIEELTFQGWLRSLLKWKLANSEQSERLKAVWGKMPSRLRKDNELILTYVECLAEVGEISEAVNLIEKSVAKEWSDGLVEFYGRLPIERPERSLKIIKDWLTQKPKSVAALLAAGRIALRSKQWESAQSYFERCLEERQSPEVCGELGRLFSSLGDHTRSNEYFQRGLTKLVDDLPELPMPGRAVTH